MAAKPARNWIPTACQAEKCLKSCAEGALEAFQAEKGIISCAEWDTTRLPGRKMPEIRRGRCPGGIWGRKRYLKYAILVTMLYICASKYLLIQ